MLHRSVSLNYNSVQDKQGLVSGFVRNVKIIHNLELSRINLYRKITIRDVDENQEKLFRNNEFLVFVKF